MGESYERYGYHNFVRHENEYKPNECKKFCLLGYNSVYSVDFQRTTRLYIPQDKTLHNHRSENLKPTVCKREKVRVVYGRHISLLNEVKLWAYLIFFFSLVCMSDSRERKPGFFPPSPSRFVKKIKIEGGGNISNVNNKSYSYLIKTRVAPVENSTCILIISYMGFLTTINLPCIFPRFSSLLRVIELYVML
jgi:hypothetical protein